LSERIRVDARELVRIESTPDGRGICLHLVDEAGRTVVLRLPAHAVRAVGDLVPRPPEPACLHPVESWRLRPTDDGAALILTLHTPEGCAASYRMNAWQIEGIATLASHSGSTLKPGRLLN